MVGNLGVPNVGRDIGSLLAADCSSNSILRKHCVNGLVWMGFHVFDSSLEWWLVGIRKTLFRNIDPASTRNLFNLASVRDAKDHFAVAFAYTTELIYTGGARRRVTCTCNPRHVRFQ
jgi:hypothetical protein